MSRPGPTERLSVSLDVSAVPAQPRGAGRYTVELVTALTGRPEVDLTLVARTADTARWSGLAPRADVLAAAPGPRPLRLAWEQARLPAVLARYQPDVHHGPHYTLPQRARLPLVVTIHDLTFFDHPEWHERSKVVFFRHSIRRAVRRAEVVICISGPTARRLQELTEPRGRVVVAPHGVDPERFRPVGAPGVDDEEDRQRLDAVGVRPPYVVFLGTLEPRKGIDVLIQAFDRLAPSFPDHSLVLAGGDGWGREGLEAAAGAMIHRRQLVRTGFVPDPTAAALLRRASAVVYPAWVEGFGLPVIEALASGAPVITTAGSVMDELADGVAQTFVPGSVSSLAERLEEVLGGAEDASARRRRGLEVAGGFSWPASARAHVEAYRAALGGARPPR